MGGEVNSPADEDYTGVIENYGRNKGIGSMSERLSNFFGEDANNISYKGRVICQAFVQQVAIPITLGYLRNANWVSESPQCKTFEEIIGRRFQNIELLNYSEKHFDFSLLDLRWKVSTDKMNTIVASVFDSLIRQICLVFNRYQRDLMVLPGRPTSLFSFRTLFKKYLTLSVRNPINLNNYWVGRWYPFADGNGFINDPKAVVSVGTIVALMAGKLFKIRDLKIDITHITQQLMSTTDYIACLKNNKKEMILSPKKNENELMVSSLPFHSGYSKSLAKNYPYADLYSIRINEVEAEVYVHHKCPTQTEDYVLRQIEVKKNAIRQHLPLRMPLVRDYDENKETIRIKSVEDAQGNEKPHKYFVIHYQTLKDEKGYQLDKCELILNAK